MWKHKRPQRVKAILNKNSDTGSITIPDTKLHYRAKAIKTRYQHKKTDMKINRTKQKN
jgi:hypothetical protein